MHSNLIEQLVTAALLAFAYASEPRRGTAYRGSGEKYAPASLSDMAQVHAQQKKS